MTEKKKLIIIPGEERQTEIRPIAKKRGDDSGVVRKRRFPKPSGPLRKRKSESPIPEKVKMKRSRD